MLRSDVEEIPELEMLAQIGPATAGQTAKPPAGPADSAQDTRARDDRAGRETFQSVLEGDNRRAREHEPPAPEGDRDRAVLPKEGESTDAEGPAMPEDAEADAEAAQFAADTPSDAALADETLANPDDDPAGDAEAEGTAASETVPKAGVPAWFVPSLSRADASAEETSGPITTGKASAAPVAAALAEQIAGTAPAAKGTPLAQAAMGADGASDAGTVQKVPDGSGSSQRELAPGRTAMTPGLQMKATEAPAGAAPGAAAMVAEAPGQALKDATDARRTAERAVGPETMPDTAPAGRVAPRAPAAAETSVAALQIRAAAPQADPAAATETVRWLSDAGVVSEMPVAEQPATQRMHHANTPFQQAEMPRNVALQLAQAMRQGGGDKPMELVLSPAELGRVRISMQTGEAGIIVQVLAERPETLDLMRRNIDLLAQEFHDIGFGTAEFAFGQNAPQQGGAGNDAQGSGTGSAAPERTEGEPAEEQVVARSPGVQSDRVDIRL